MITSFVPRSGAGTSIPGPVNKPQSQTHMLHWTSILQWTDI